MQLRWKTIDGTEIPEYAFFNKNGEYMVLQSREEIEQSEDSKACVGVRWTGWEDVELNVN